MIHGTLVGLASGRGVSNHLCSRPTFCGSMAKCQSLPSSEITVLVGWPAARPENEKARAQIAKVVIVHVRAFIMFTISLTEVILSVAKDLAAIGGDSSLRSE